MNRREWAQSVLAACGFAVTTYGKELRSQQQRLLTRPLQQSRSIRPAVYCGYYEIRLDMMVPATVRNFMVDIKIPCDTLQCFMMVAYDPYRRANMNPESVLHVSVNGCWFPDSRLELAAGQCIVWGSDHLRPKPFSRDVNALYVTNHSDEQVRLRVAALYN